MIELTNDQILQHLKKDTVERNNQLSVLVNLLNSLKENTVLAIDGPWGSGKTVFIKQLCMLADGEVEDYGHHALDDVAIERLRVTQKVFYFNAWENDYINDALGAIILKLIAESNEGLNEAAIKRAIGTINPSAAIKKLTLDSVDFNSKTKKEKLVEHIQSIVDRHDAVNEFLDDLKGIDGKRIILVIDELDRCRPSFAVDLLEVIKHYFVRDDITFVMATNTKELAHTVQKYYGYKFDGPSYLNKFFDYSLGLSTIEIERYTRSVLSWQSNGFVVHEVAHDAIKYFGFQMREINSYNSALRLIDNFLIRKRNWEETQWSVQLVFTPLALALKVKNDPRYSDFVSGKGADILTEFLPSSNSAMHYASRLVEDRAALQQDEIKEKSIEALIAHYKKLFVRDGGYSSESLESFHNAVSLMSNYTTIASEEIKK